MMPKANHFKGFTRLAAIAAAAVFALLAAAVALTSCGSAQRSETPDEIASIDHSSEGMRAMNMETDDPSSAGVGVEWSSEPATPQPGEPVTLHYRVSDARSGQVLTDLPTSHERPMHLIAVSKDLAQFQHIHPEADASGAYSIETTFPGAGTVVLFDEFAPNGRMVLDRHELPVGKASEAGASLASDLAPKTDDGVTVALSAPEMIKAGEEASFTFALTRDGRPVTDLEPYLGAAAHVAIVSADTSDFAHTHGEEVVGREAHQGHEGMGSMGSGSLPSAFGPEVGFRHTFPSPGLYKIWAQFGYEGRVITVPYVVEVQ